MSGAAAELGAFAAYLRGLAEPVVTRLQPEFRDEMGARVPVDAPLAAWVLGFDAGPAPPDPSPEVALWRALVEGRDPTGIVRCCDGPLFDRAGDVALEIWTEGELCGLHALWHLGTREAKLRERATEAARWHLENLQPDNATNRPWACHVFAIIGVIEGDPGARLHAQTLVGNSLVQQGGRPDRRSALILMDAARAMEGYCGT